MAQNLLELGKVKAAAAVPIPLTKEGVNFGARHFKTESAHCLVEFRTTHLPQI